MKYGSPTVQWVSLSVLLLLLVTAVSFTFDRRTDAKQSDRAEKLSPDLKELARGSSKDERVSVIFQFKGNRGAGFDNAVLNSGGRVKLELKQLNARVMEIPARAVEALASRPDVGFVSLDRPNLPLGHVSLTSGADAARTVSGTNTTGLDGTGLGIAVLDSGIDTTHTAFLDRSNNLRVIVSRDFTGEGRTDDPFGHGTHVAAVAAGNGRVSNAEYLGIAPNANLINLRVLGATGTGTVSGILAALDWVLANRSTYNIRIVNASLGTPAIDSYQNDPICRAVRRLVDAGVVVIAAAGNNGRNGLGQKIYGQIHSPGNEPSAITVGAANTFGTNERSDDEIASFSSRGPTRSSWT
ncbi:MAG TPA: S8 family serine peptidase, partial [Pyrinomonadaceae bacterium]